MNGGEFDAAAAVAPEENEFAREIDEEERENEEVEEDEEEQEMACDQFGGLGLQEGEGEEAELRPKLAEGFYEIEAVRRKRVRKGQVQYLIKWRGWPETANTWEPYVNLISCSDIIEAFEESLRSGKHRSRKRKRRSSGPIPQAKKKPQGTTASATSSALATGRVKFNEGNLVIPFLDDVSHNNGGRSELGDINNDEAIEQGNENGHVLMTLQVEEGKDHNEMDVNLGESADTPFTSVGSNKLAADILESETSEVICFENGHQKVDGKGPVQAGARLGNRKRKPTSVKRFNQEQTPCVTNYAAQDLTTKNTRSCGIAGQHWDTNSVYKSSDLDSKDKSDNITDTFSITDIIKPVSFASSESVPDILVTFMAKRSDGKEVMVDNKYLKSHNPLLLINYYEQHLNYTTTAGPGRSGRDNIAG